jgi:2-haloacid dehalogenase
VFDSIRAISFDCYGTLIDWQSGLLAAAHPVLRRVNKPMEPAQLYSAFADAERRAEQPPYRSYREVLRSVAGELFGPDASHAELDALWRSIGEWPAFRDTAPSLERLKSRYALAVASNIDDDLFALTRPKLGAALDELVTAQQVRSYKPCVAHFHALRERLKLDASEILHVAESRYHDVEPASRLGFATVWVDRTGGGESASGPGAGKPDLRVGSLSELVGKLGIT